MYFELGSDILCFRFTKSDGHRGELLCRRQLGLQRFHRHEGDAHA